MPETFPIVAPVAIFRRPSLETIKDQCMIERSTPLIFTRDSVTIWMIDKNEDHSIDMQHVSFHNSRKQKLKEIVSITSNQMTKVLHVR